MHIFYSTDIFNLMFTTHLQCLFVAFVQKMFTGLFCENWTQETAASIWSLEKANSWCFFYFNGLVFAVWVKDDWQADMRGLYLPPGWKQGPGLLLQCERRCHLPSWRLWGNNRECESLRAWCSWIHSLAMVYFDRLYV